MNPAVRFLILSFLFLSVSGAQSPNGTISGIVHDPSDRPIPDAEVIIVNDLTNIQYQTKTSDEGIYIVRDLPPGSYRIQVTKRGFKTLIKPGLILNVQNALSVSITLPLGAVTEVITVEAGAPLINTTDASVSTVVDRQFAENLPLNGRSFQSLITLAPGVVLTTSNYADNGQFSVNGQQASSNYWMVDGVSANIGIGANSTAYPGNGLSGGLGSFSAMGGTNSLVSVDALEEFRIQTSTYAPEFGRVPGGQISIVTRSGTNQFHGTAFDYFRNDMLDANDWFANANRLRKPEERQNDFGGTFNGPIVKDKTFFFFSYEGLRLRLPQVTQTTVPDLAAREAALPALQPYFNGYPLPNGTDTPATGIAQFNASFSNRSTLDAYSLRVDHKLGAAVALFGRYNYSPSNIVLRGGGGALSTVTPTDMTTQTATAGLTWAVSPRTSNDFRFNYSRVHASMSSYLDAFGGATPPASFPFPPGYNSDNGLFLFYILSLTQPYLSSGQSITNLQRQVNLVDGYAAQVGTHALKFGLDYRRLRPVYEPTKYEQIALFNSVPLAQNGQLLQAATQTNLTPTFLFRNLGVYAQDTWRILPQLTMTYGLRWDVDFVPQTINAPRFPAVDGFVAGDLSHLAISGSSNPPYDTAFGNVAPRFGLNYAVTQSQSWQTVVRGGFGLFYDLASSQFGSQIGTNHYPFGSLFIQNGGTFPLVDAAAAPPPIAAPTLANRGTLYAFDPKLELPYTLEWNVALEQGLGNSQTVSVSYVGASGRRLLQTLGALNPNPNLYAVRVVTNSGSSSYDALQARFQRRLSHGLQALASYTWSHSIDTGSAGSTALASNIYVPSDIAGSNRGPSDFDVRNAFSAALTYDVPSPRGSAVAKAILGGWSTKNILQARSALPVDVTVTQFSRFSGGLSGDVRPDVVAGQPPYLFGPQYPGGKAFNPAALAPPPLDPVTHLPMQQGTLGRNSLRGFGATQWDFSAHREFPIRESLKLQFRAEMFNVLNHPNFGPPSGKFGQGGFGVASQMFGSSLNNQNLGGGAFSALYQVGGPRSVQLALKLSF
jgi:hypothetical protein